MITATNKLANELHVSLSMCKNILSLAQDRDAPAFYEVGSVPQTWQETTWREPEAEDAYGWVNLYSAIGKLTKLIIAYGANRSPDEKSVSELCAALQISKVILGIAADWGVPAHYALENIPKTWKGTRASKSEANPGWISLPKALVKIDSVIEQVPHSLKSSEIADYMPFGIFGNKFFEVMPTHESFNSTGRLYQITVAEKERLVFVPASREHLDYSQTHDMDFKKAAFLSTAPNSARGFFALPEIQPLVTTEANDRISSLLIQRASKPEGARLLPATM